MVRRQLVHAAFAAASFAVSGLVAQLLGDYSLLLQMVGQGVIAAAVVGTMAFGGRWIPATQVLAHRLRLPAGQNLVRGAWTAMR
jgi:hypothetical protein